MFAEKCRTLHEQHCVPSKELRGNAQIKYCLQLAGPGPVIGVLPARPLWGGYLLSLWGIQCLRAWGSRVSFYLFREKIS